MKKKNLLISLGLLVFLVIFTGCKDGKDTIERGTLTLSPDKNTIISDGEDAVTFTVNLDGVDVTSASRIYYGDQKTEISGNKFSTTESGSYRFTASYEDYVSGNVTVEAKENVEIPTFHKKVAIHYFTSVGCQYCPEMRTVLTQVRETYEDDYIVMTYHTNQVGTDPMYFADVRTVETELGISGWPHVAVDGRDKTTSRTTSEIIRLIGRAMDRSDAPVGIKVITEENDYNITVEVEVTPVVDGDYKIAVVLLEDGLEYPNNPQTMGDGSRNPDYVHNEVVRRILSEPNGTAMNDQKAGVKFTKTFEALVSSGIKVENCTIVVYVTEKTFSSGVAKFYVNNITSCKLTESVDYIYAE